MFVFFRIAAACPVNKTYSCFTKANATVSMVTSLMKKHGSVKRTYVSNRTRFYRQYYTTIVYDYTYIHICILNE